MTKITQKQLIGSLKQLKEIKPRKEWAVLLKSQILAEKQVEAVVVKNPAKFASVMNTFSSVFFQRKMAYAFAAFLFLVVGVFSFSKYAMPGDLLFPAKKISEQSQAALMGQTGINNDVAVLSNRINDLAQVAKEGKVNNIPSAIIEINANVSQLTKSLKNNPTQNSKTIKEIATSLKTLADVPGTDLSENSDVKDLYQTVVQSQIADLEKSTLTDDQANILIEIKSLYDQGKYNDALEKILLISQ